MNKSESIKAFSAGIQNWKPAYRSAVKTYLAYKGQSGWQISFARLILSPYENENVRSFVVQTNSIIAGRNVLPVETEVVNNLLEQLDNDVYPIGEEVAHLAHDEYNELGGTVYRNYRPNYPSTHRTQTVVLSSRTGSIVTTLGIDHADLELRSAANPYDGLNDLLAELGISEHARDFEARVEVVAETPAIISGRSIITDRILAVEILASQRIAQNEVVLGIRVPGADGVYHRFSVDSSQILWTYTGTELLGSYRYDVGDAKLAQCFLNYMGEHLSRWWVVDPSKEFNYRTSLHHVFDPKQENLEALLDPPKQHSRNLEIGTDVLLTLHGFSVLNYGAVKGRLEDGPDLLACTPNHRIAAIECTIGLPDVHNKLLKLLERVEKVKKHLAASGHAYLEVIPVLVTNLSRQDIKEHVKSVERLQVAIMCKEELDNLVERLRFPPDPEGLLDEAKRLMPQPV